MKKNDIVNLRQQLEELEKEIERLKKENPDDDYKDLDENIGRFKKMISEDNLKKLKKEYLRKKILSIFLNYLFHIFTTFSILGFCMGFINMDKRQLMAFIVPLLAFIIFVYRKVSLKLIFYGPLSNHKIIYSLSFIFLFVAIISILDFYFFNIWTSIWNAILTLIIINIVTDVAEFIYYRKLVMKYTRGNKNE